MDASSEYYKTKESVDEYIQLAKDVDGRELIEQFKKYISLNSRILELGSGPGSDWEILNRDFDVVGSDNSDEFLNHLKVCYPIGTFVNLDAITLQTDDAFDAIYSNKVLQHLSDDELTASIERQFNILNPNGIICHSFWAGEGSEIFKGLFVNYHTKEKLISFFEEQFAILELVGYAEFEEDDSLLLIGKKIEDAARK